MIKWTQRKIYINDTFQISLGKFVLVLLISFFQFLGMLCDNGWVLTGSMFFLFANAILSLSKSEKENMITENDLYKLINGIETLIEDGKSKEEILEIIKSS